MAYAESEFARIMTVTKLTGLTSVPWHLSLTVSVKVMQRFVQLVKCWNVYHSSGTGESGQNH